MIGLFQTLEVVERMTNRFIKTQSTAVQTQLVDIGGKQTSLDTEHAFVLDDGSKALEQTGVNLFACPLAANSPWSCIRVLMSSIGLVTVTAPQAAMPPAMNPPTVLIFFLAGLKTTLD